MNGVGPILAVESAVVRYGKLTAVDGLSLSVQEGETLGLVGESGCGKTSLAKALVRLLPLAAGRILLEGIDTRSAAASAKSWLPRRIQLLFQDPVASLSPRLTIRRLLEEPLRIRRALDARLLAGCRRYLHRAWPGARHSRPLSPSIERRPGAARVDGAGAGHAAADHRGRRADRRSRSLGPGRDAEPAGPGAARSGAHLSRRQPQSQYRGADHRPGGGDVSGPDRRARQRRAASSTGRRITTRRPCSPPILSSIPSIAVSASC